MWTIQYGDHQKGISQLPDEKEISRVKPTFSRTAIPIELTVILPDEAWSGKLKWRNLCRSSRNF